MILGKNHVENFLNAKSIKAASPNPSFKRAAANAPSQEPIARVAATPLRKTSSAGMRA